MVDSGREPSSHARKAPNRPHGWPDNCSVLDRTWQVRRRASRPGEGLVLTTLAVTLLIHWLLCLVNGYLCGASVQRLLAAALVSQLVKTPSGRRVRA